MTAIAVIGALVADCAVAAAAPAPSPFGYALAAEGFSSYFVFHAGPRRTVHGVLRVLNTSPRASTILLSPAAVSTAAAGGLQYSDRLQRRDATWVRLSRHTVRLAAGQSADVGFVVRVPAKPGPGEHFASIVARNRAAVTTRVSDARSIRLRVIPRLAMTILTRTPGELTRALRVGSAAIAIAPSGASLRLGLSNPKDALISSSTGHVTVSQDGEPLFRTELSLGPFVPGTRIAYHIPWRGTPAAGTYTVTGTIDPAHARPVTFTRTVRFEDGAIQLYRRETGRPARDAAGIPAWLFALLALAIASAVIFAAAYARARQRIAAPHG